MSLESDPETFINKPPSHPGSSRSHREKVRRVLTIPEHLLCISQVTFGPILEDENFLHLTDEETEAQGGVTNCPNVTQLVVESSLESMLFC